MAGPRRQPRWAARLLCALVVVVAGCGDDDDSEGRSDGTSTSTTSTTLSAEAEVEAAYLAFAEMGARLLQAPDPADPEIAQRTSGEAQSDLIDGLTALRDAGERYELGPQYDQEVLSVAVNDGSATAEVCVVEDSRRVVALTGDVLAEGLTAVIWSVRLAQADGLWLVERIVEGEVREGEAECV